MANKKRRPDDGSALPSKQEIVDYLAKSDGSATRRDLARAFGVKGDARTSLRALLREMDAAGDIDLKSGKRLAAAGVLPPVAPLDIMSVDEDGDLLCMPVNWRGGGDPPLISLPARKAAKRKPPPGVGDRILARLTPQGDDGYEAEVIRAIGKGAHRFLAVFRKETRHQASAGRAEPVERRARNSFTIERGDDRGARDGDLVWVETKNARGYGAQKGRVVEITGHIDDAGAYSVLALANRSIPTEFPKAVLAEADKASAPDWAGREDLRKTPLITIDPDDAKDHDDAVFAEPDPDPQNKGGYRILVAIADVSHFVRMGSALDKEAQKRGNSVYLPDRVVPMLPERLSNDLCSLREGEDRPAMVAELVLNDRGVKTAHRFFRAVMRSAAKLSYTQAQAIRDKKHGASPELTALIDHLYAAYELRKEERKKRAPLDLDLPERRVLIDENGAVKAVVKRERFDAHKVIEEYMILANIAAAEFLERARTPLIYRVHDQPDPEHLDGMRDYLKTLGYSLINSDAVRPMHFNQLLKIAGDREEKEMVSEVVLRAQRQAVYASENVGHFGLNLPRYAHFTSPIRRYADLTVHRAITKAARLGHDGQSDQEAAALDEIAEQISNYERRAIAAEREATDRYMADYLSAHEGAEFDGRIRGVTKFGLFVSLDETGADGFIPIRLLGRERYRFEDELHRLVGEQSGGMYRLGQAVRVQLAEATPLTGGLRFTMLSAPLPREKKSKYKASKRSQPVTKKGRKPSKTKPKSKKRGKKNNAKPRTD